MNMSQFDDIAENIESSKQAAKRMEELLKKLQTIESPELLMIHYSELLFVHRKMSPMLNEDFDLI